MHAAATNFSGRRRFEIPRTPQGLPFAGTWTPFKPLTDVCAHYEEMPYWRECHLAAPVKVLDESTTRGVIIGPMHSLPGQWHSIVYNLDECGILRDGDQIIEYRGDAVDELGSVPYPPLHLHHIHVHHEDRSGTHSTHWFETHGDYDLTDHGYSRRIPEGYAVVFRGGKVRVEAQVNDVRHQVDLAMSADTSQRTTSLLRSTAGASRGSFVEWSLRIEFRLAAREVARRPIIKLSLWHPMTTAAMEDTLLRYHVTRSASVWWWTTRTPELCGGTITDAWVHSHRARYGGVLLVKGNHSPASLSMGMPAAWDACEPSETGTGRLCGALAQLKQRLVRDAAAARLLLCRDDDTADSVLQLQPQRGGLGGYHDRQGRLVCDSTARLDARQYTVLAFSDVLYGAQVDPFPQHTMIFLYVDLPDEVHRRVPQTMDCSPRGYSEWRLGRAAVTHGRASPLGCQIKPDEELTSDGAHRCGESCGGRDM